ncbi:hypothetical protein MA16_Dca010259 [Dendrobium catenatum]|uniref:Uncharacterized protein n=1 Tax=Dendrobium catenatum TaxID=906689 RepID=A0A2I0W398_9ASPA|nr:hypothetical protein MA16_Dca010259 [Dendrobium catenatum]
MVALACLRLRTIGIKVHLEESFGKKKISLVSKDPVTPPHGGREVEHERKEEIVKGYKKVIYDVKHFNHGKEVAFEEVEDEDGDACDACNLLERDEDFMVGGEGVGYVEAYAGDEVSS